MSSYPPQPDDSNTVPIGCVYVPSVGFVPLLGSTNTYTDGAGNKYAPPNFNLSQVGAVAPQLDGGSSNRLGVSLYGKQSAAGDTALLLDSTGHVLTAQTLGGNTLADTNALPTVSSIQQMILNGKSYSCSTGLVTAAANQAASFFFPNTNAKKILVWSVRLSYSNAALSSDFRFITADDSNIVAGTSDAGNVLNLGGGGASSSGFAMHHASAVTAPTAGATTLPLDGILNATNANAELLSPGMFLALPASTAQGIACYTPTTAAGKWSFTVRWSEYT